MRLIIRDRGEDSSVITPEREEITGTGRNGAKANKRSTTKVVVCGLTCRLSSRCTIWPRVERDPDFVGRAKRPRNRGSSRCSALRYVSRGHHYGPPSIVSTLNLLSSDRLPIIVLMGEISVEYKVGIDFDPHADRAERVFLSMAALVHSFSSLDTILVGTVYAEASTVQSLVRVQEGSLVSWLLDKILFRNQQTLDQEPDVAALKDYVVESREAFVAESAAIEGAPTYDDLRRTAERIDEVAQRKQIARYTNYAPLTSVTVGETLRDFSHATSELSVADKPFFQGAGIRLAIPKRSPFSLSAVKDDLTSHVEDHESVETLILKKPDLIGKSQWSLQHGGRSFLVTIADEDWLGRLHDRRISIRSGDAIRVRLRTTIRYDANGDIVDEHYEAVEVLGLTGENG